MVTFTYDSIGRKSKFQDPDGNLTTYQYDADSRTTTVLFNSGAKRLTTYD